MIIGEKQSIIEDQVTQDIDNIKNEILSYIQEHYKAQYIGELKITKIEPIGFKVVFGLNAPERPLTIMAQLDTCDFIKFIKKEIKERSMDLVKYFIGIQTLPEQCEINTSCSCQKMN